MKGRKSPCKVTKARAKAKWQEIKEPGLRYKKTGKIERGSSYKEL